MKKIYVILFVCLASWPVFAENSHFGNFKPETKLADLPADTYLRLNYNLLFDRIDTKSVYSVFEIFDDGVLVDNSEKPSGTIFQLWLAPLTFLDAENVKVLQTHGGFSLPAGTIFKTSQPYAMANGVGMMLVFANGPIDFYGVKISNLTLTCDLGLGAWWKNEDEAIHLDNMIYNMGGYLSILTNEEKEKVAKDIQEKSIIKAQKDEENRIAQEKKEEYAKKVADLQARFPDGLENVKERLRNGCTVWKAYGLNSIETFLIYSKNSVPNKIIVLNRTFDKNPKVIYQLSSVNNQKNLVSYDGRRLNIQELLRYASTDFLTNPSFAYFISPTPALTRIKITDETCPE